MKDFTGHTVLNGELMHASVSSVKKFDANTKGGCALAWAYSKVLGMHEADSEKSKEAKDKGLSLDKELKKYLATGDKALSGLALRGLHILEQPGDDLRLDVPVHAAYYFDEQGRERNDPPRDTDGCVTKLPPGWSVKITSRLTAAGVPFVGELDVAHERGHYRDNDGVYHADPPGTVEVGDIKFKTNARDKDGNSNLFLPTDMIRDIQMAGYGEWVARVRPNTSHVRLSMLYFPEKERSKQGTPTKVTRLHVLEDCHKTWARVESVVREMKDVVRHTASIGRKPAHLPDREWAEANAHLLRVVPGAREISTCDAYGGCVHREYCEGYRRNSLDKLYLPTAEKIAADHLQEMNAMGLMANNPQMFQQNPQTTAPMMPQQNMQAQLAAEEQQLKQQAAQQQAQMPVQITGQQLADLCQRMIGYGFGFPAMGGNLAQFYAACGGQNVMPGFVFNGQPAPAGAQKSLHGLQLNEVSHLLALEGELAQARGVPPFMQQPTAVPGLAVQQPQPVQVPQQPGFTQNLANAYNQQLASTPMQPQYAGQLPQGTSFMAPDAPVSMPQLAMQQIPQQQQTPVGATDAMPQAAGSPPTGDQQSEAKAGPGRPKGSGKKKDSTPAGSTAPVQGTSPTASSAPQQQAPASVPSASTPVQTGLNPSCVILVNARFSNLQTRSLNEYVDYINRVAAERYNVGLDGSRGMLDVRAAKKDTVLAFGGWPGVVRELVKTEPPPEGLYHLDTFMDNLNEAVADALRVVADMRGWTFIRGMRG